MFTQEVNVEAMYRATELLFGPQASMIIAKLADVIDKAMVDGYEQGLTDGQENLEAACDASFDNGYDLGAEFVADCAAAEGTYSEGYDDGYLDGVRDVRLNPALADETVQDIINVRAEAHFESLTFGEDGWVEVENDRA